MGLVCKTLEDGPKLSPIGCKWTLNMLIELFSKMCLGHNHSVDDSSSNCMWFVIQHVKKSKYHLEIKDEPQVVQYWLKH